MKSRKLKPRESDLRDQGKDCEKNYWRISQVVCQSFFWGPSRDKSLSEVKTIIQMKYTKEKIEAAMSLKAISLLIKGLFDTLLKCWLPEGRNMMPSQRHALTGQYQLKRAS